MKLQTIFITLLGVALVFTIVGLIVNDFNTYYTPNEPVKDIWNSSYDYTQSIQSDFGNISYDLNQIGQQETGWLNILKGLAVFASGVITAIKIVLTSPAKAISLMTYTFNELGIPGQVTAIFGVILIGVTVIMIVKFMHTRQAV